MIKYLLGENVISQKALIVGLARQGVALAQYLCDIGNEVTVTDLRTAADLAYEIDSLERYDIDFVLEEHPLSLLENVDTVFVSGGVPLDIPLLQIATKANIPISNDSQIVLDNLSCQTIGITGSSGKTTTTQLSSEICSLSSQFDNVWVGGNIGNPLLLDLPEILEGDIAILELSSFQLQIMDRSPNIAVVLNITPNHLDRHSNMEEYIMAKANILEYQGSDDIAILGWDNEFSQSMKSQVRGKCWGFTLDSNATFDNGCVIEDDTVMLRRHGNSVPVINCNDIRVIGTHNLLNILASVCVAGALDVEVNFIRQGLSSFKGVPHRMEFVADIEGVRWMNDTMATTPERTIAVLESLTEPVILLLGGKDKNLSWESLAVAMLSKVKKVVVFGQSSFLIKSSLEEVWVNYNRGDLRLSLLSDDIGVMDDGSGFDKLIKRSTAGEAANPDPVPVDISVTEVDNLEEAVLLASSLSDPGDTVLLAPGCTSFDQFSDAIERGEYYRELVLRLQ